MAGFRAHLAGGMISGAAISLMGFSLKELSPTQAGAIFVVGSVGGLLPDLDSDTGKPLAFLFQLISILIPSMLFGKASQLGGKSLEFLICYFSLSYIFINYVGCFIIKRITIHRGMMHSVPFAFLCGGIGYLLFASSGDKVALMGGAAVFLGYFGHLILDELSSFKLRFGFVPTLKSTSGTALKFASPSVLATFFTYLALALVLVAVILSTMGHSPF